MHLWNVFFLLSSYFCYYFSQLQLAQTQEVTFLNHNTKKKLSSFFDEVARMLKTDGV